MRGRRSTFLFRCSFCCRFLLFLLGFLLLFFIGWFLLFVHNAQLLLALALSAILFPLLHLLLVLLKFLLQPLQCGRKVVGGHWWIDFELIKEGEGLDVVLDGLPSTTGVLLLGAFLWTLGSLLLGWSKVELIAILFLYNKSEAFSFVLCVTLVLLFCSLLFLLLRQQVLTEGHCLLQECPFCHERFLVLLLLFALLLPILPLLVS
mmetsp:Transcript_10670/g.19367  ORF Transcript_10670/g.19367 Transcript_10670/m.19367 type:complete len:205 (-) Transcript_10670:1015-1629(-)